MGKAIKFLIGLNCFTTVMGICMLIASSYARSQMKEETWGYLSQQNAAALGIVTGLFTLVLSMVGCVGAAARQKRLLCCYMLGLTIVFCLQIGAAVMMTTYANSLNIRDVTLPSSKLTFAPDIAINNAAFSVFMKCCSGCPDNICNNPEPEAFFNGTLPNCSGNTTCHIVTPCDVTLEPKCFVYPPETPIVVPPLAIPDTVCTALSNVWLGSPSHAIVGPADSGSCGKGDPTSFMNDMDRFLSTSLLGVAGFFTFVAVVEGIALIAGFYLLFCSKQNQVNGEEDDQVYV